MPIELSARGSAQAATLFLFAHPDDEFGVFAEIESAAVGGQRPVCIYLTDASFRGQSPERRNAESVAVLSRLGVDREDVHFLGLELGVPDGALHRRAGEVCDAVLKLLSRLGAVSRILMPAWEGGHQDHDAAHLVGLAVARDLSLMPRAFQFSLYNGANLPGPLFRVLAPLPSNGPVIERPVPWSHRVRYLRHCLSYPSQWRSWLGLFPLVLVEYLVAGRQRLQPVDPFRAGEAPHGGRTLYERRGFCTFSEVAQCAKRFGFHLA